MRKIIVINALLMSIIAVFLVVKYLQYRDFQTTPLSLEQPVTVLIEKGMTWKQVAQELAQKGIVTNARFFYYLVKERGWDKGLKTGEYEFVGDLTPEMVAQIIVSGKVKLYSITIPEGYNKYDMANLLAGIEWVREGADFVTYCDAPRVLRQLGIPEATTCEGLLFPSTYKFPRGVTVEEIITAMDRKMQEVLKRHQEAIRQSGMKPLQVLTLASIVEKESGVTEEQPRIAGVYLNRIKKGMKLQADPTVIYGLLPGFTGNLTRADLERDHPYNTYLRPGLPPGPICFPGENAIRSVVAPATTEEIFFVATGDGTHYFSKTYEEHSAAVEHYQVKGQRTPFVWKKR